jgi:hypothetical protein
MYLNKKKHETRVEKTEKVLSIQQKRIFTSVLCIRSLLKLCQYRISLHSITYELITTREESS